MLAKYLDNSCCSDYSLKMYVMKTFQRRTGLGLLALSAVLALLLTSCSKDDLDTNNGDPTYSTTGNASGSQQTPPVTTTGSGTMTGAYNARTNNWDYDIDWSTLAGTVTAVQIHGPATIGASGSLQVALTITTNGVNGNATGSVTLTEQQEAYLLAGQLYYTLLTTAHVTGEVRGQISAALIN
jgi:hypothetical protein